MRALVSVCIGVACTGVCCVDCCVWIYCLCGFVLNGLVSVPKANQRFIKSTLPGARHYKDRARTNK